MDVHRKRSQVALVDEHGGQLLNRNLANDSAELTLLLGRLEAGTPVAFGAACGWGWLAELLEELELEPHLVHPSRCKAIASARLKDDRVDARTLAQLLRAELLPEAWIAPRPSATSVAGCATGPHWFGWPPRSSAGCMPSWPTGASGHRAVVGPAGRAWLAELPLPRVQRTVVTDCLALVDAIGPLVARLERDLLARTSSDPRVQALQALPGIGPITAMTLVAEIGDSSRFPTARTLCAWAGLTRRCATPTIRSATATSPSWARRGSASCSKRPPSEPRPARRSPPSTPRPPPAAAPTSPPWRLPASSLLAAFMYSPSSKPRPEKVKLPGALAPSHVPETPPKD